MNEVQLIGGFQSKMRSIREILRAYIGAEIFPLGRVGVVWRLHGVGADMAEGAGHAYSVGADEVFRHVVGGVGVVADGVPFSAAWSKSGFGKSRRPTMPVPYP